MWNYEYLMDSYSWVAVFLTKLPIEFFFWISFNPPDPGSQLQDGLGRHAHNTQRPCRANPQQLREPHRIPPSFEPPRMKFVLLQLLLVASVTVLSFLPPPTAGAPVRRNDVDDDDDDQPQPCSMDAPIIACPGYTLRYVRPPPNPNPPAASSKTHAMLPCIKS